MQLSYNNQGQTELTLAARYGRMESLQRLLESGADPNQPSADGRTPLLWACTYGRTEAFEMLLSFGADPDEAAAAKQAKRSAFGGAIQDDLEWIAQIRSLYAASAQANEYRVEKAKLARTVRSKLIAEAKRSNDIFFCMLIQCGIPSEVLTYDDTPPGPPRYAVPSLLMFAVIGGCRRAVKLLLDKTLRDGGTINQCDERGRTALMYASQVLKADFVLDLLAHGADAQVRDKSGKRAAEYAALSAEKAGKTAEYQHLINLLNNEE